MLAQLLLLMYKLGNGDLSTARKLRHIGLSCYRATIHTTCKMHYCVPCCSNCCCCRPLLLPDDLPSALLQYIHTYIHKPNNGWWRKTRTERIRMNKIIGRVVCKAVLISSSLRSPRPTNPKSTPLSSPCSPSPHAFPNPFSPIYFLKSTILA